MPGAVIAIDQDRPSGTSYGDSGVARKDLWKGRVVRPRCATSGNSSYLWSLLDVPPDSETEITSGTEVQSACEFTFDTTNTIRLQLITNGGGPGNIQILTCAARFDETGQLLRRGWRIPALGEQANESNFDGQDRGWDEALQEILNDLLDVLETLADGGAQAPSTFSYTLLAGVVADHPAVGAKRTLGAVYFDPTVLVEAGALERHVTFEAVLQTSHVDHPAFLYLCDAAGDIVDPEAVLQVADTVPTFVSIELSSLSSASPALLQAQLFMDPWDVGQTVTCLHAAIVVKTIVPEP